jgi:hypothetical protein
MMRGKRAISGKQVQPMPAERRGQTRKWEAAIAALLSEPTIEQAAGKAQVSYRTLKSWLGMPEFSQLYRDSRRQIVEAALTQLQRATGEAVETLRRNLACGEPGPEIRAAVAILEHAVRAVETLDLAQQLAELKQQIGEARRDRSNARSTGSSAPPARSGGDGDRQPGAGTVADGPGADLRGGGNEPGPLATGLAPLFE